MSCLIFALFTVLAAVVIGIKAREVWPRAGPIGATGYRQEIVSCQGAARPGGCGDGEEAVRAER
jgi:hypothetical protein